MIIFKEFIWQQDHFAYHITEKENMFSICSHGLLPKNGERSKSVEDFGKAIYFFDSLYSLPMWMDALYKEKDRSIAL